MSWIDAQVLVAIYALFPDPYAALGIAGAPGYALPESTREPKSDPAEPVLDRLRQLDQTLRSHLTLLADQVDEFSLLPEELARLRGEAISVLISLRELHSRVPELDDLEPPTG